MARLARAEVFSPDEIAIVHVMNRTVRRCFLMGDDPLTGKNYDHRKQWLEQELVRLAAYFGIDLLCYAILSNHFHLILRSRPDVVAAWDDTEVARRWLTLCPLRRDELGNPVEPDEAQLNRIRKDPQKLAAIRSRLSDISWWMRLLSQKVAQRANREDDEVGKFWQARYRAVRLIDEASLLACAAYVDLNVIRAAMAESLETSDYTSIQKRLRSAGRPAGGRAASRRSRGSRQRKRGQGASGLDAFLAPLEIDERRDPSGPCCHRKGRRASDKGFLAMSFSAYVELLEWTVAEIRAGRRGGRRVGRGSEPSVRLQRTFKRLGIRPRVWCELVQQFGRLFYVMAGKPEAIDARRSRDGRRYRARPAARELLAA